MNQKTKPTAPKLIKFKTGYSADKIEQVEVLRETAACVFLVPLGFQKNGKTERREAKQGDYAQYHDTWVAARAYLLCKAESKVKEVRRQLDIANGQLGNIKGMKPRKEGN